MPTYVYEAVEGEKGCPACHAGFEVQHAISDPPPKKCPRCGGRVRKRLVATQLSKGRWNEKRTMSDDHLKRHGFTQIRNEGDGKFRID